MEKLIGLLEDLQPDVDYEREENLVGDHILTSLMIVSLVAELEDAFDIEISARDVTPENFNSAKAIWELVRRLTDE